MLLFLSSPLGPPLHVTTEGAELFLCPALKLTSGISGEIIFAGVNVMCDGDYCWSGQWTAPSWVHNPRNTDQYPIRISLSEPLLPRSQLGWQFLWLSLSHNFQSHPDWWGHSTSDTSHSLRAAQNRTDVRKTSFDHTKVKLLTENLEILTFIWLSPDHNLTFPSLISVNYQFV